MKNRVLQQVVKPSNIGGVGTEYNALINSQISEEYLMIPMVLEKAHKGINLKDISFYYHFIKKENPQIIHIRGAAIDGLNAIIAAKMVGRGKIFVAVHGMYSDLVYIGKIKRWVSKNIIEKLTFDFADGISCVSKKVEERSIFDSYRSKMLPCVYNRIPNYDEYISKKAYFRSVLHLSEDCILGCYVGRITLEKGLQYLTGAFELLDEEWPQNFYFLVIGDGAYRSVMQEKCKEFKNGNKILFFGQQKDVYKFLIASDFFLQPSLHENLSISILEACAAKIPCIVTDVGGNSEIISSNYNGILIPSKNEMEIANSIKCFLDKDTLDIFKRNMKASDFSRFSKENVNRQLIEAYNLIKKGEF